ncbi:U3 small nucleolar RNA-associated protein 12 [Candida viswanathii]|uniref:U3 small nucleolar RNA-associated protein 12 n=1 Tax=Candida viswanathii TaxID=5486 RepID=A0A367YBY4_9ASCO|nr:U3 small nucleolar RNA-associated protein 12 [Candida viswanathii]
MVKSYNRYDQEKCFGVITSHSNIVWLPPSETQSSTSAGRALTSGLEEILIWDIKTGELLLRFRDGLTPGASNASTTTPPSPVSFLAYHAQTNIVAAGYADGGIKVWDVASGSVIISFEGHKSAVSQLMFDRSGTRLVSGSNDTSIIVWDLVGEVGLFKLKGHKGPITGVEFLSEAHTDEGEEEDLDKMDDYLVSVSRDGLIKLWELKSQQCIETHLAHSNDCWSMAINKSSDMLITSGNKDQVKVWSVDLEKEDGVKIHERGSFEKTSKSRSNEIAFRSLKTSSETVQLFSIQNADRTIEIFRIRSDDEIKRGITKRTKRLKEKGMDEDEILESLQNSEISMLITPFTTIRTMAKITSACWTSNVKKLDILVSLNNNSIEYDTIPVPETPKKAQPTDLHSVKLHSIDLLGHRTDIRAMDISPQDNKLLATASNGELKIWNTRTYNVIRTFTLEGGYALCCKFLPGGALIAVGFKNGDLELYDLATSSLVDRVEKAHSIVGGSEDDSAAIWSLDITPDGKTLVTGGNDKCVKFWNFKVEQDVIPGTNTTVSQLKFVHTQTLDLNEDVLCVKISPDAKFLAISLLNNNVQVVFLDTLKLFLTLYGHKLPVLSIDISSDSKLIITSSADKNIKIWGLDFGDCHKSLFAHQDSIMNVKFIGDTHHFFSSGKDGLIKYWDGDKFECIQKLPAHQSEVWCMAISDNGLFMCSTSHDHSIRLWLATDDQVFLEEEKEKELDEMYENKLLDQIEGDGAGDARMRNEDEDGDEIVDESTKVSKQTMETLKAGEKLMEALDIGIEDVEAEKEYQTLLKQGKPATKPTPHSILLAFNMTASQYVLSVLSKIKPAQLDDALLVLPFSYSLKLLQFIEIWTNKENILGNIVSISLICKVLFFVIGANSKELISQKDPHLKNQLMKVKEQLRGELLSTTKQLGVNTQGLKFIKQQWKLLHASEFVDEEEDLKASEEKRVGAKRSHAAI